MGPLTAFMVLLSGIFGDEKEHGNRDAGVTKIMFGSCNTARMEQWAWGPVMQKSPDAWVWLGDSVYGDLNVTEYSSFGAKWRPATPPHLRRLYDIQREKPGYSKLVNSGIPIFGTWDDHDYGNDNADSTYEFRAESQREFLDFLGEAQDSPRRSREGVYETHTLEKGRIRLILLDVRYHRTPYDDDGDEGDFLGEEQWAWLEKTLRESDAEINLIGGGIQFLAPRASILGLNVAESWTRFPKARQRLLDTVLNSGARAPLFMSGDVHFAELSEGFCRQGSKGDEARIVEITSSGMTHSWGTEPFWFRSLLSLFLSFPGNNDYQAYPIVDKLNFAEMQIRLVEFLQNKL
uniref:PhoD-like phosphatase metallophosphatase domain-containing protein n=1 Tax=Lotharella globosa TaxID=91324 RepID=A0A7S3ZDN7_9EUKA